MKSRTFVAAVVAMYAILGLFGLGFAMTARAQGEDIAGIAASNLPGIVIITIVAGGAAMFVKGLGSKVRTLLIVVALAGLGLTALALTQGTTTTTTGNGGPGVKWNVIGLANQANWDTTAEILDSNGFVACDGGTPDLNGNIGGAATKLIITNATLTWRFQGTEASGAARNAVTFIDVDCPVISFNIGLTQPRDLNGDGTSDAVAWGFRLLSMSPTTIGDWNRTATPPLFYSASKGYECAGYNEGNEWVSCYGNAPTPNQMPTTGDWVYLGTHAGGGTAMDIGAIALVFAIPDGMPVGYQYPATTGQLAFSATFAVGSPEDPHVITMDYVLLARA